MSARPNSQATKRQSSPTKATKANQPTSQAQPDDLLDDSVKAFVGLVTGSVFDAPEIPSPEIEESDTNGNESGTPPERGSGRAMGGEPDGRGNITINFGGLFRPSSTGQRKRPATAPTPASKGKEAEDESGSDE